MSLVAETVTKKCKLKKNAALRERLPLIVDVVKNVRSDGWLQKKVLKKYYIAAKKHTSDMVGYIKGITRTENANAVQGASGQVAQDEERRLKVRHTRDLKRLGVRTLTLVV